MPRLTKKFIDGLKPKSQDVFVWDSEIRGLGVRLKPSGTKKPSSSNIATSPIAHGDWSSVSLAYSPLSSHAR